MDIQSTGIRKRFVEHDWLFKKIRSENPYITVDEIVSILSEQKELSDVTLVFYPKVSGFQTKIIDNFTDYEITVEDLTPFAFDFYIRQVNELTLMQHKVRMYNEEIEMEKKALACIKRIKEMLAQMENRPVQYKVAQ